MAPSLTLDMAQVCSLSGWELFACELATWVNVVQRD